MPRRFPSPWSAERIPGGYVVKDATGQALPFNSIRLAYLNRLRSARLIPSHCSKDGADREDGRSRRSRARSTARRGRPSFSKLSLSLLHVNPNTSCPSSVTGLTSQLERRASERRPLSLFALFFLGRPAARLDRCCALHLRMFSVSGTCTGPLGDRSPIDERLRSGLG